MRQGHLPQFPASPEPKVATLPRIYIAGPYSGGDVAANVDRAMRAWHQLADLGFAPFCPHLSHFLHIQTQRPYAEWLAHDLIWLKQCQAVLRLPGDSSGADGEVALAEREGIPVYGSVHALAGAYL